ncbi:MAG: deoxyribonuclease IV [Nocardioides sp.]
MTPPPALGSPAKGSPAIGSLAIGAHVDQTDPIAEAQARGASLVQFFLGNPQGYKGPSVAYAGGAEGLRDDAAAAGVDLYVHAPYLINVATTNNRIRIPSRKLLQQHIDGAAAIGAKGLIVHGGHVGDDDDPAVGFDNWRKAIAATDLKVPLLLENTAGGENAMARYLDRIARTWDAIQAAPGAEQVGFCLDTCHAHAGGIPLESVVEQIRAVTGRIDLVHCNDSRDAFDSGADRHANFGAGTIDPDLLAAVVRDAGAPVICETPGDADAHLADFAWLRARL